MLDARLTELGNVFGDMDSDVKALQAVDKGKLTTFMLHDYWHYVQNICQ